MAPPWGGVWIDPTLPPDSPGKFGGTVDPASPPFIVYPPNEAMHPINVGDITVQWLRGKPTNSVFRLRFWDPTSSYDFIVPCTREECIYKLPEAEWLALALANAGKRLALQITGTDGNNGPVSHSNNFWVLYSPAPVRGGLYYWSTAQKGTFRLTLGDKQAQPYILPNSASNMKNCGGCHSLSRNGRVVAFSAFPDGATRGTLGVAPAIDPANPTISSGRPELDASVMALNPDGSRVLVSFDAKLSVFDTANGMKVGEVPPAFLGPKAAGYFPEWSPDGNNIALTLAAKRNRFITDLDYDVGDGDIAILPYNNGAFGMVNVIVPQDAQFFHFYPSWSPSGEWIVFASAPLGSGRHGSQDNLAVESTYNHPLARLQLVRSTGGQVYTLGRGSASFSAYSTWPKFSPFEQLNGKILFVTFNSKLDYGFLLKNSLQPDPFKGVPQLWMFAIDLNNLPGDPSWAPIWLPFQDVNQNNHLPYWTNFLACGQTVPCPVGKTCRDGICI